MPEAARRGAELGCAAIQVFVKSPTQWRPHRLRRGEAAAFRATIARGPVRATIAHGTYLVNLAATDRETLRRSRQTLGSELGRCQTLGIPALVIHPGAHLGRGVAAALETVAAALERVLRQRRGRATRLLLENTAGQGTLLGSRLEHLAALRDAAGSPERIGICIDTCHAFAAGYRIDRPAGYDEFWRLAGELFGPGAVACLHLNDSRHGPGSRRDRHANLGRGRIGIAAFERLLHDPRLAGVPMILETPRGDGARGHRRDLELLRSLRGSRTAASAPAEAPASEL